MLGKNSKWISKSKKIFQNIKNNNIKYKNLFSPKKFSNLSFNNSIKFKFFGASIFSSFALYTIWDSKYTECESDASRIVDELFNKFASLQKGQDKKMSMEDFAKSLLPSYLHDALLKMNREQFANEQVFSKKIYSALSSAADINKDKLIDKAEFIYVLTLLSIPKKDFQIVFKMFDKDNSGKIDQSEWQGVIDLLCSSWGISRTDGLVRANVMGISGGKKGIGFNDFSNFLTRLRESVQELEFNILDENRDGAISSKQFARSLLSYSNVSDINTYLSRIDDMEKTGFTKKQYLDWYRVLDHIEEINSAIQLFVTSGKPYTADKFKKTAKIVSGIDLELEQINLVFALFDENRDGLLSNEEFSKIVSNRNRRGLQTSYTSGKQHVTYFDLFACSFDCLKSEVFDRSSR
eukprot:TRINITY_DN7024_c0_g1_i1.p1 TRINITY_DN7024_c0_g1~~TRINITY_DN7024_c0_g1_i1.p1  ORF type:complete len:407 (+),score=117.54 TRINITY_DN7024_c0_g1_i1:336-1556(+)